MDRLAEFALNNDMQSYNQEMNIYSMFKVNIDKVSGEEAHMTPTRSWRTRGRWSSRTCLTCRWLS